VSEALRERRHSTRVRRASRVSVRDVRNALLVDVDDDGVGGADPARGSGLRGLVDRVHALDGELKSTHTPGSGTRLHGDPCA
jgi:signal transduction histidine kinase